MKYFFLGPNFKPAYIMLSEIFSLDYVEYISFGIQPELIYKLYKTIGLIKAVIRYVVKKRFDTNRYKNKKECVFLYYDKWDLLAIETGLLDQLKKQCPDAIHICFLNDAILAQKTDIEMLKTNYDRVYIYDKDEARSLGIYYAFPPYSKVYNQDEIEISYDVTYVGASKNRLKDIIEVYKWLIKMNLKCKFYIVVERTDHPVAIEGITYSKKYLSPERYFKEYIAPSKCLLEISNPESGALTARVREAIMYDKKLLTNNPKVTNIPFFNNKMIQVYNNVESIDVTFFDRPSMSYNYSDEFSPMKLLHEYKCAYMEIKNV